MFSTAIVIFRETLEISLLLGIVFAATQGVPGRLFWIVGGLFAGLCGASAVAVFAGEISDMAEGVGQELFNACVLFVAALFIGWTVLWMRKHAREMTANLRHVGQQVAVGNLPRYSLSAIVALALLREGSEIVLFIYGMIASGEPKAEIVSGSVLGLIVGGLTGLAVYLGLLRISTKHMLRVTGWILMLLVAGLAAQGVGFLSAAGYFGSFSHPVWDTSWLLSDGSFLGRALHSLVGYTAKPSGIQVSIYLATLGALAVLVAVIDGRVRGGAVAVGAAGLLFALLVLKTHPAFALDYISSPVITKGELEIEYAGTSSFDHDASKNAAQEHELQVEYAPLDFWKTEVSMVFARDPGMRVEADALEWENFVEFWEQGEKWVDAGAVVAYAHAIHHDAADAIEAKLLLEKQTGQFLHRTNIGFEQEIGGKAAGGPDFSFLWSSRYRMGQHFEPGFEIQSDLGSDSTLGHYRDQEHYIGPAAYGEIVHNVKYEAALLAGISSAASDAAGRFKLEYETVF